jgi:hypothetical protein
MGHQVAGATVLEIEYRWLVAAIAAQTSAIIAALAASAEVLGNIAQTVTRRPFTVLLATRNPYPS